MYLSFFTVFSWNAVIYRQENRYPVISYFSLLKKKSLESGQYKTNIFWTHLELKKQTVKDLFNKGITLDKKLHLNRVSKERLVKKLMPLPKLQILFLRENWESI